MTGYLGPRFFNDIQSNNFPSGEYEGYPLIRPGTSISGGVLKINRDNYGLIVDWSQDYKFSEEARLETLYNRVLENYESRESKADQFSFLDALNQEICEKLDFSCGIMIRLNEKDQDDFPIQRALLEEEAACKEFSLISAAIMEKAVHQDYLTGVPTINYTAIIDDLETAEKYLGEDLVETFRKDDDEDSWKNDAITPFDADIEGHQWAELFTEGGRIVIDPSHNNIGIPEDLSDFGGYLPEHEWQSHG